MNRRPPSPSYPAYLAAFMRHRDGVSYAAGTVFTPDQLSSITATEVYRYFSFKTFLVEGFVVVVSHPKQSAL